MKVPLLMMISIVGILLLCVSYSDAQTGITNDPFYLVRPTDPAPSNIHDNCYGNIIFYTVCLTWTDPFDPNFPNAIKLRHPYSRYTLMVSSSLGGSLVVPSLVQNEITLTRDSAANLIGPGATVTFKVAGQQIDNPAALSLFSPIPLVLQFPTVNFTVPTTPPVDPDTTNGIRRVKITYNAATSSFMATWTLGTRPLVNTTLNAYCDRLGGGLKVNAHGKVKSSTATSLSVPFKYKGNFRCKVRVTALYSNGAAQDFVKKYLNFAQQ